MQALDDTYLDDAVGARFQDFVAFSRFERTGQDIDEFFARVRLVSARAGRRLSANLPAVFAPAQLLKVAMLSDTNRWLVLTAARAELGDVGGAIVSMRRTLSEPGGGDGQTLALVADITADHLSPNTEFEASGDADVDIQQAFATYKKAKGEFKKSKSSHKNVLFGGHRDNPISTKSGEQLGFFL